MATRLFPTTSLRTQIQLAGFWDFLPDPQGRGEANKYFDRFPKPETRIWIPGTWNTYARYWHYEGPAWFRRRFQVPNEGRLRLRFAGVFYRARVWLDGKFLGAHEGGYTPFSFTEANPGKGEHELVVMADNSLDDETVPKGGVDWFPYGGIYRPVYAELVPDVFIHDFHVTPSVASAQTANLRVKVFLRNGSGTDREEQVTFEVNGRVLYSQKLKLNGAEPEVSFSVPLEKPNLWSPASPFLYTARLYLPQTGDDQYTRFGVRSFVSDGPRILLNGEPFKVRGANRHDDHPDWGSAVPPHIIRQDVEILKRLGANAARSHYPVDEMFMDFCDENGLVFLDEVPAWQNLPAQLAKESVQNKIKAQFREMVYRDMNHPCVLSWSLGNEWPEFEKSHDIIKSLIEYARSIDNSHFITFVTGGARTGPISALLDVICTNWAQYQWYDPFTCPAPEEAEKAMAKLNRIHESFPDKPVLITELGAAESQAGWHNWGNVKWSEEYQARNVSDSARYSLDQDWIAGGLVWQYADTRSAPSRFLAGRLRGWNAKGVVDGYRSPKMAFYKLQELFHDFQAVGSRATKTTEQMADQTGRTGSQR
ncbi:MAG: hypothetical protein EHM61_19295 [Acidobacteria bacterium]|nr:MAG: hypothetical protein EHM61_19295 [Acidobacteriota bacterium]